MTAEKINIGSSDETRITVLEISINNINNSLLRFEKRFDQIDAKFDKIEQKFEQKFDRFEQRFDRIDAESKTHHRWTMGGIFGLYAIVISSLVGVFGIVVKLVH